MRLTQILFALAGTAFLLVVSGVVMSGGGLSRGVLGEPLNSVVVALTWIAALALPLLLIGALASAVVALLRSGTGRRRGTSRRRAPSDPVRQRAGATASERNAVLLLVVLAAAALYFMVFNNQSSSAALAAFAVLIGGLIATIRVVRRIRTERRERREAGG